MINYLIQLDQFKTIYFLFGRGEACLESHFDFLGDEKELPWHLALVDKNYEQADNENTLIEAFRYIRVSMFCEKIFYLIID